MIPGIQLPTHGYHNKEIVIMKLDKTWFTEVCSNNGSAFSLKITNHLHSEQTAYQKIDIFATETFGNLMVIDDFIMLSNRDNFLYHEMITHPALFTHKAPKSILIIGGGDCGTLLEVTKHTQIEHIDMVELDERVTRLAEKYFPELCVANQDKRANIQFGDGILWVKHAADNQYDIVIVDCTDPIGPAEGLFSREFYSECSRVLKADGILVQQSESPLYHMALLKSMYSALYKAEFSTVHSLQFPQPVYPSGWWTATMAGKTSDLTRFRTNDSNNKSFSTRYYNSEIHQSALAVPEMMRQLTSIKDNNL